MVAPGLPDIQWYYSGFDAQFHEPIRRNDEIAAEAEYVDVKEVSGRNVARMLVQTGEVRYRNQHGRLATRVLSHCYRVARNSAEGGLRYEARARQEYTKAELRKIRDAMLGEYRRGADTLYWEDVREGEPLPEIVRGPLNQLDMTCYYAGAVGTSGYKSTKLKAKYAFWAEEDPDKLPNNYDPSYYSAAESPSIGHQIEAIATRELGMPGAYDNGPQRSGFMAVCVTNWIGDDGFVRNYGIRLRRPVIFGDTNHIGGRVTGKRVDGTRALVEIELVARNQLGERHGNRHGERGASASSPMTSRTDTSTRGALHMDKSTAAAIESGKAHFMQTLGNVPEPIRAMMEHVPEHFVGYLQFREAVYRGPENGGQLDLKTKELLYTVLDIVTGNEDGAKNHGRAAFAAGMTSGELAEACMQVMHVCGVTTWGKTGYKVVDFIAGLERGGASTQRR